MANEEKSRDAFEPKKRYAAVGMQQGRVMLDDDFNENERIRLEEERRVNLDVIGPAGSPDDGFLVANGSVANGAVNFEIEAGTFYLGGLRLWNPETATFQLQDDWLQQAASDRPAVVDGRVDLAYVEAWQQPVTATEDTELFEVALGGPDTSTRLRTMWRVKLAVDVDGSDCPAAWGSVVKGWDGTLDETGELVVDTKLEVDYFEGEIGDLCTPAIAGGYLGAENQTIRVQLLPGKTFTWGFDNAAPVYQVDVAADRKTVTLATDPRDQAHWPTAGQIIEILPPSARLANKEKLAAQRGHLARVKKSFDPVSHVLEIDPPIPLGFGADWLARPDHAELHGTGFFMRVWDRGDDQLSPLAIPVGADVKLGNTGVKVTFTGTDFLPGDFWVISARPKTPQVFVPWDLAAGRHVHGIRRFFAPLALIEWHGDGTFDVLHDCRPHFLPLTKVRGCCTYTVGDGIGSFGKFNTIQAAVNALPKDGGKVCILAGTYAENVVVDGKTNVTIEGCGRRTIIAPANEKPAFTISKSSFVTIRDLAILNLPGPGVFAHDAGDAPGDEISELALAELEISVRDQSAIDARNIEQLRIARCRIAVADLQLILGKTSLGKSAAIFASGDRIEIVDNEVATEASRLFSRSPFGGIQIGGGSTDVEIRHNRVSGGSGNAITLGSVIYVSLQLLDVVFTNGWRSLLDGIVYAPAGHWIIITEQGCVGIVWVPDPPPGGNGQPLFPLSEGALANIRIVDNDLSGAAFAGIAVARYFSEEDQQLITTDDLLITDNRIHGNLTAANVEIDADMRDSAAFGAIALADGERIVIRDNMIERNGPSHVDPICGVFSLHATGISIENNRIIDNAPRTIATSAAKAGFRGGIVLPSVAPPGEFVGKDLFRLRNGYPSVRIHDNHVSCALGRALLIVGAGTMSIEDNQLSSHGIVQSMAVEGYTNGLVETGFMPAADLGANRARVKSKSFSYAKGVTMGANRFDLKGMWQTEPVNALLGSTLIDGLDVIGGVTVMVINLGTALEQAALRAANGHVVTNALTRFKKASGKVAFADNQVALDFTSTGELPTYSSVLLFSLDDVGMEDNQIEEFSGQTVFFDVIEIALTARMGGNRIAQDLGGKRRVSAIVAGAATQVTSNTTTYCLGSFASTPQFRVFANNLELVATSHDACAFADNLAEIYGTAIVDYLLT